MAGTFKFIARTSRQIEFNFTINFLKYKNLINDALSQKLLDPAVDPFAMQR